MPTLSNSTAPLPFPARAADAHKGDVGRVLMIGGSRGMAGSIALASIAALKTGSGLVSAAVPDRCLETVAGFHPGIMTIPLADRGAPPVDSDGHDDGQFDLSASLPALDSYDAIGCGPGMRTGPGSIRIVERLIAESISKSTRPLVLDADAINIIAAQRMLDCPALPRMKCSLILTPHPGELARLTGVAANDREAQIAAAAELVQRHALTIVVKGSPTVVLGQSRSLHDVDHVSPSRYINTTGNPGMATAGSGDVLTGIVTSLLGQGLSAWDAARLGVYLHGMAGDIAADDHSAPGMTCVELLQSLPSAIAAMLRDHPLS